MKERYFTSKTIRQKSDEIYQQVKSIKKHVPYTYEQDHSALLILDMQHYFLDQKSHAFIPSAPAIIQDISLLANLYHQKNYLVILTRHLNTNENAQLMKTWWQDLITKQNPHSTIINTFHHPDNHIIEKTQYDAFYDTTLHTLLKRQGIKQLIITGVMTHLCVEATTRSAFSHGYQVFLPIDGTATYNKTFHRSTFNNLTHGYAVPTMIQDHIKRLQETL